jgi:serine phosphatase RsbU (regulator of sigma subunit)
LLVTSLFAQSKPTTINLDSLEQVAMGMVDNIKKVELLGEIAWKHRNRKTNKSIELNEKAIALAYQLNQENLLPTLLNHQSVFLELLGKYPEALTEAFKAIKISEKYQNNKELAYANNNIANVNYRLADYSNTQEYAKIALTLFENSKDSSGVAYATLRFAEAAAMQKQYSKAIEAAQKGLNIRLLQNDLLGMNVAYTILGRIYEKQSKYDSALLYLEKSRELAVNLKNEKGLLNCLNVLTTIYIAQKKYAEAKKYALESLALTQKTATKVHLKDTYKNLADIYYIEGNYAKAIEYQDLFVNYKNEIYNEEKAILISTLTHQHENEEELANLHLLRRQAEKNKTILYGALSIAGVLLGMLSFLIYNNQRQRNVNKKLGKQQQELKDKNELVEEFIDELNDKNEHIIASIQYAKRIQRAVLISDEKFMQLFSESFIIFQPKEIVGGDFYWATEIEEWNEVGEVFKNKVLVVGDCTGHGVPGGFISLIACSILDQIVQGRGLYQPDLVLLEVHKMLRNLLRADAHNSYDSIDISYCYIDQQQQQILYTGAIQTLYYVVENTIHTLRGDKVSLGSVIDDNISFHLHTIPIQVPMILYVATDGYTDQLGGDNRKKFGAKNFTQLLQEIHGLSMGTQKEKLQTTFNNWLGKTYKQVDDLTIIGVKI